MDTAAVAFAQVQQGLFQLLPSLAERTASHAAATPSAAAPDPTQHLNGGQPYAAAEANGGVHEEPVSMPSIPQVCDQFFAAALLVN